MFGQSFRRLVVTLLTATTMLGIGVVAATPANAATTERVSSVVALAPAQTELAVAPAPVQGGATVASRVYCSWPRCTVYLSRTETTNWAYWGVVPQPPMGGALATAWYLLVMVHRWFAIQYANWGWCVGFQISAYPWETQGMFGYRC